MNFFQKTLLLGTSVLALGLSGCIQDKCEQEMTYKKWVPSYMSYQELRSLAIGQEAPRNLVEPGKIYYRSPYIFICEKNEGIHVIDNSNPSAPQNISFISIPGNQDVAVKGNLLYADSYVDLLVFDISNIQQISLANRKENALFYQGTMNGWSADPSLGVVTEWTEQMVTETVPCGGGVYALEDFANGGGPFMTMGGNQSAGGTNDGGNNNNNGKGGSMARFTLAGDYLYAVSEYQLRPINLSTPANPELRADVSIGWGIETIFPYGQNLFIGSNNGMHIYNIANPEVPAYVSQFRHATACDPVAVDGKHAYVTQRSGEDACMNAQNLLAVVNIEDLSNPTLVRNYEMTKPKGLGVDRGALFLCDQGLKVYDTADPANLDQHQLAHFSNMDSYDVIPLGQTLLMIGADGLYQYDYSDPANITQLSVIPVSQ